MHSNVSPLGLARRVGWGRNSLRRPVDQVEAALVVPVWLDDSGSIATPPLTPVRRGGVGRLAVRRGGARRHRVAPGSP
ncbi:hypothetical protein [Kutzneria chonburiensis]|uniref:Uncharacterized protein n=1 Tax=Kutzneria chonburiensis TaxID=1483604 RepID=A0ABV6MNH9_9PSEU